MDFAEFKKMRKQRLQALIAQYVPPGMSPAAYPVRPLNTTPVEAPVAAAVEAPVEASVAPPVVATVEAPVAAAVEPPVAAAVEAAVPTSRQKKALLVALDDAPVALSDADAKAQKPKRQRVRKLVM